MRKNILIVIPFIVIAFIVNGCEEQKVEKPEASFIIENVDGSDTYLVGKEVRIISTGTGAKLVVYTGDAGSNIDSANAHPYKLSDGETTHIYNEGGTYKVVLIASNVGEWGDDIKTDKAEQTITVTDYSVGFQDFKWSTGEQAVVDNDERTITFTVSPLVDRSNKVVQFNKIGNTVVKYNGEEVVPFQSALDFTDNFILECSTPDTVVNYNVVINETTLSSENTLNSFDIIGVSGSDAYSAVGSINSGTVSFSFPYGVEFNGSTEFKVSATSSKGSSVYFGNTKIGSGTDVALKDSLITVIAQDGTENTYNLSHTTASTEPFFSYTFAGLVPQPSESNGTVMMDIPNDSIQVKVLNGTDITSLVAEYTGTEGVVVKVDGTKQESGVTANDFTTPKMYRIETFGGDSLKTIKVSVVELSK